MTILKRVTLAFIFALACCYMAHGQNQTTILQGQTGSRGYTGARGPAGNLSIHSVITGDPGTPVTITNVGTASDASLDITIPRGSVLLNGSGAPTSGIGGNGDYYFQTTGACLWGPKASGAWPGSCSALTASSSVSGPTYKIAAYNGASAGTGVNQQANANVATDSTGNNLIVPGTVSATSVSASTSFLGPDNFVVGDNGAGYTAIGVNGASTNGSRVGLSGKAGDPNLYADVLTGGAFAFGVGGSTLAKINSAGLGLGGVTPTHLFDIGSAAYVDSSGNGTFNTISVAGDPTSSNQAATKHYVDSHAGGGGAVVWGTAQNSVGGINTGLYSGNQGGGQVIFNDRPAGASGWISSFSLAFPTVPTSSQLMYIVVGTFSGGSVTITGVSSFTLPASATGTTLTGSIGGGTATKITFNAGTDFAPISISSGQFIGLWTSSSNSLPSWDAQGNPHGVWFYASSSAPTAGTFSLSNYTNDDFAIQASIQPILPSEPAITFTGPISNCSDDSTNQVTRCAITGFVGGVSPQVQFNNNGVPAGSADFTYTTSTHTLAATNASFSNAAIGSITTTGNVGVGVSPTHTLDLGANVHFDSNGSFKLGSLSYDGTTLTAGQMYIHQIYTQPGYNYGAPGAGPSVGWGGPTMITYQMDSAQSGINNFVNFLANSNGMGDINGINYYWTWNGGSQAGSDEGGTGIRNYPTIGTGALTGTLWGGNGVATSSTSHRVYLTCCTATGTIGVGRLVINATSDVQAVTVTATTVVTAGVGSAGDHYVLMNLSTSPATASIQSTLNAAVNVPKGTNGVYDLYVNTSSAWTVGSMFTCSGAFIEASKVITADAPSGGVQHITAHMYNSHFAGETCFEGGWAGRYASNDSATALTGDKHLFYVLGSPAANQLAVIRATPNGGDFGYLGGGGYHIYHGATVVDAVNDIGLADGYQFNISDWDGTWNSGDTINVTVPLSQLYAYWAEEIINANPYSAGNNFNIGCTPGPSCGGYNKMDIFSFTNSNPDTLYNYDGGPYVAPDFIKTAGPVYDFAYFYDSPRRAIFEVQNIWSGVFNLLQIDSGGYLQYQPGDTMLHAFDNQVWDDAHNAGNGKFAFNGWITSGATGPADGSTCTGSHGWKFTSDGHQGYCDGTVFHRTL